MAGAGARSRRRGGRIRGAARAARSSTARRPAIVGSFDPRQRRLGPGAEVPAADDDRVPAPAARGDRRSAPRSTIALRSLDAMAAGGIHDQLGGGFHRYATDAAWLVPHFEQMLYDNAQLARVYAHAWALTGDPALPRDDDRGRSTTCRARAATADGGFAASQDADTDGEEGAHVHVDRGRGPRGASATMPRCSRRPTASPTQGNWEGRTILSRVRGRRRARRSGSGWRPDEVGAAARRRPGGAARAPRGARRSRPATTRCSRPGTGSRSRRSRTRRGRCRATGDPALAELAARYRGGRRRARRTRCSTGSGPPTAGCDDRGRTGGRRRTACSRTTRTSPTGCSRCTRRRSTSAGSTAAVGARGRDPRPLRRSRPAASSTRPTTASGSSSGPRDVQDNATPSGGAMAATVLLRLAALTGEDRYRDGGRAGASRRCGRSSRATRPRSRSGCARSQLAHAPDRRRSRSSASRRDDGRARCSPRLDRGLPPVPGAGGVGGAGRLVGRRCSATGSRSTAARPRSSAATSRAACRSPSPRRSRRSLSGREAGRRTGRRGRPRGPRRPSSCCGRARDGPEVLLTRRPVDDGVRAGAPRVPGRRARPVGLPMPRAIRTSPPRSGSCSRRSASTSRPMRSSPCRGG